MKSCAQGDSGRTLRQFSVWKGWGGRFNDGTSLTVGTASFPDGVLESDLHQGRVPVFSSLCDIDDTGFAVHEWLDEGFPCELCLDFRSIDHRIVRRERVGTKDDRAVCVSGQKW